MSNQKTILTVVGRSASGKDYIAKRLSTILGYPLVVSYTTRPKRKNEIDGVEHWFVSKEEFKNIIENQTVIAYTKIGEYEYCAILEDIQDNCIYVIDPNGINYLKEKFENEVNIVVIYIHCAKELRKERASIRSDYMTAWKQRNKDEDRQFTEFEMNREWDYLINNNTEIDLNKIKKKIREVIKMKMEIKNGIY